MSDYVIEVETIGDVSNMYITERGAGVSFRLVSFFADDSIHFKTTIKQEDLIEFIERYAPSLKMTLKKRLNLEKLSGDPEYTIVYREISIEVWLLQHTEDYVLVEFKRNGKVLQSLTFESDKMWDAEYFVGTAHNIIDEYN